MDHHRTHEVRERSVGEWLHSHAHEHGPEGDLINWQGESHHEFHRQHPGFSHEHPHYRSAGHAYDHHDPAAEPDHPGHVHVRYADNISADHPTNI